MDNSKIYQLISSFSQKELKQISSLFKTDVMGLNESEKLIFSAIAENVNNPEKIAKKRLFNVVFSGQVYNDQKIRLSMSRLFKALERYISFSQIQNRENEHINRLLLSKYYRKKELKKLYSSNAKQTGLDNLMSLDFELEYAFEDYQFNSLEKRNQELNIQSLLDLADKSFYAKKLRIACYALSHGAIYATDYSFRHIEDILSDISENELHADPRIGVYYYCYLMITNPDNENSYLNYKHFLFNHQRYFEFEEKRSLYFFALNQCIKKLNSGQLGFGQEGLEIYQNAIDNETLFINGHLSRFTYRNVAMMAIRINDFELAEKLTDHYEGFLRKEDRESAFHFNKALINYYKKDLDVALENIMKADFKDHLINLAAKTLQAKIYYELNENQLLDSHLDSVEMYLIRKKVLGYHRKNYKNFIRYTKGLVKLKPYNKEKRQKLQDKINSEEVLTEKKWLLEQLV